MGSCGRLYMSGSDRTSRLRKCGERWRGLSVSERLRIWRGLFVGLFEDCNSEREGCDVEPGAAARSSSAGGGVFLCGWRRRVVAGSLGASRADTRLGGPESFSPRPALSPSNKKAAESSHTATRAGEGRRQIRSEAPPPADRWPFIDEDAGRRRAFECVGRSATGQYFNGDPSLPMHSTRTAPPAEVRLSASAEAD